MADNGDAKQKEREKAEKLAAARKRFEELKKKKQPTKKGGGNTPSTVTNATTSLPEEPSTEKPSVDSFEETVPIIASEKLEGNKEAVGPSNPEVIEAEKGPALPPVASSSKNPETRLDGSGPLVRPRNISGASHTRRQSLTAAEVLRSSEMYSPTAELSPEASLPDIYRKQASTINELRTDKQHLLDEITKLRERAKKTEEMMVERDKALEDLASTSEELKVIKEKFGIDQVAFQDGKLEVNNLNAEISSLNRQISHLHSQIAQKDKTIADIRQDSSSGSPTGLEDALKSKEEQIESMSVELSDLRSSLEKAVSSADKSSAEVKFLKSQLKSIEDERGDANTYAEDLNRKLKATTERLVIEAAEKSSHETKFRTLEATLGESRKLIAELQYKVKQLEESNSTLNLSRKEADARFSDMTKRISNSQRENAGLQTRLADLKSDLHQSLTENQRLREELRKGKMQSGLSQLDEEEINNLEDEERDKLKLRLRQLEDQLHHTHPDKNGAAQGTYLASGVSRHAEDDSTTRFSDVDLQSFTNQPRSLNILGGVGSVGDLFLRNRVKDDAYHNRREYEEQERQARIEQVKKELAGWKGHKLDLTAVGGYYGDTYGDMFEV